jgi:hypothetical protein
MLEITNPKVIAVEGKDEKNFFTALIINLRMSDFQIIEFEGKTNFRTGIRSIVNIPGFRNVRYFALIRDADEFPPQSAFESIRQSLSQTNLPVPAQLNTFTQTTPSVGVFIMPGSSEVGMLEDLCLSSIKEYPINACIDSFLECSEEKPQNESKSRILCYLSTKSPLVNSLGLGALKGYWDFNSPSFDEIKSFLENMR